MDPIRKLVSERLRAQARAPHPDADLLSAFVENSLSRGQRNQVIDHLSDCQDCREILYLSLPEADKAQTVLSFNRNRAWLFRFRWASLIALVVIASAVLTTRYQLLTTRNRPSAAAVPQSVSTYAKLEKLPSESDRPRSATATNKVGRLALDKGLPEVKAMHAKPAANLDFDQSGQVHMRAPAPRAEPGAPSLPGSNAALPDDLFVSAENSKRTTLGERNVMARADALKRTRLPDQATAPTNVITASAPTLSEKEEARSVTVNHGTVTTSFRRELIPFPAGAPLFAWTLSPEGAVLRSPDQGKSWQAVPAAQGGPFAALSSVGTHVWIGGKGGALYHSPDSGQSWHEVVPLAGDRRLKTDVNHIEFSDPLNGVVTTADGERWTTTDGGLSWRHN